MFGSKQKAQIAGLQATVAYLQTQINTLQTAHGSRLLSVESSLTSLQSHVVTNLIGLSETVTQNAEQSAIDKTNGDLYVDMNPFDEPRKLKDVVKAIAVHLGVYFHPVEAHLKAEKYVTPAPAPRKKK